MAKSEDWSVIVEIDTRPNGLPGFRIVSKGGKSGVYSGTKDVFVASRFVPIGGQDTIPVESNRSESNPSSSEAIVRDLLMIDGVATDWLRLSHNYDDCWLIVGLAIILRKLWPLVSNCWDSDAVLWTGFGDC